ncbi:MAG TPA: S1/P1 nuclease [Candidatus Acidoferrales bacterium]|nr:S1/P1 nuclease [Candidatus Acidoferrales bacterium]
MIILIVCFLLFPLPSWAFHRVGHEVIGTLAQNRLRPKTVRGISEILGANENLASIAYWADEIRPERPETRPWHFINFPVRKEVKEVSEKQMQQYCPREDCVLAQIQIDARILTNSSRSKKEKDEALRFLVHFIGDVHQPLHCGDDDDRGGNEKLIRFEGQETNLHNLWDGLISLDESAENSKLLAAKLESEITPEKVRAWAEGNEISWCMESYHIAKNTIYKNYQPGPQDLRQVNLGREYYQRMRPIVEEQLKKAGVRLAKFLNDLFGGRSLKED